MKLGEIRFTSRHRHFLKVIIINGPMLQKLKTYGRNLWDGFLLFIKLYNKEASTEENQEVMHIIQYHVSLNFIAKESYYLRLNLYNCSLSITRNLMISVHWSRTDATWAFGVVSIRDKSERLEARSHFISRWSMVIPLNIALNTTVFVGD